MIDLLLGGILLICVYTDLKSRKIYNKVIVSGLAAAMVVHAMQGGMAELADAGLGLAAGFAVLLIPYLLGGMGAGDVKLLALVGACKGALFVLSASVYMGLLGALLAAGVLLFRKGAVQRIRGLAYTLYGLRYGLKLPLQLHKGAMSATYPYGVAIAGGVVLCWWLKGL